MELKCNLFFLRVPSRTFAAKKTKKKLPLRVPSCPFVAKKTKEKLSLRVPSRLLSYLLIFLSSLCAFSIGLSAKTHALLIGIGEYKYPMPSYRFLPLHGPSEDVRMVENLLRNQFKVKDITILKDEQASRGGILNALKAIKSKSQSGDTFFFYFTGHGTRIKDTGGDEEDGFDEALVAYEYQCRTQQGVVRDDELADIFKQLKNRRVIVVMDCCHSGTAVRAIPRKIYRSRYAPPPEVSDYQPKFTIAVNPGMQDRDLPDNHIYFAASQDTQAAFEVLFPEDNKFHGLFTAYFVRGLQGDADTNNDRIISFRELYDYVKTRVSLEKPDQVPAISVKDRGVLNQVFLWQKPASIEHIEIKKLDKIRVKLDGISPKEVTYRSFGFKIEFTVNEKWDYLIKKQQGTYELYTKTGIMIREASGLYDIFKRLDAVVLGDFFKRLHNNKQEFNITMDAGTVGGYYFREGERIKYIIQPGDDCYLLWLNIDPAGNVVVLLPNLIEGGEKNFLKKDVVHTIPGEGMDIGFDFEVGGPFGKELFKLIGFKRNMDFKLLFAGCVEHPTYFFSLSSEKNCHSWAFYRRLEQLLSHSSNWSETVIEIETVSR